MPGTPNIEEYREGLKLLRENRNDQKAGDVEYAQQLASNGDKHRARVSNGKIALGIVCMALAVACPIFLGPLIVGAALAATGVAAIAAWGFFGMLIAAAAAAAVGGGKILSNQQSEHKKAQELEKESEGIQRESKRKGEQVGNVQSALVAGLGPTMADAHLAFSRYDGRKGIQSTPLNPQVSEALLGQGGLQSIRQHREESSQVRRLTAELEQIRNQLQGLQNQNQDLVQQNQQLNQQLHHHALYADHALHADRPLRPRGEGVLRV